MFNTRNKRRPRRMFFVFISIVFLAVFSALVMLLWNAVLPGLLSVPAINYWQAAGLLLLCRILFGGFQFGRGRRRFGPPARMRRKWMAMNDEERQRFKEEWQKRCEARKS